MTYTNNTSSITESSQEFKILSEGLTNISDIPDKVYVEIKKLFGNVFDVIGEMDYARGAFDVGSAGTVKDTPFYDRTVEKVHKQINNHKIKSFIINLPKLEKTMTPTKFARELVNAFTKSGFEPTKYKGLLKKIFLTTGNVYYKKIDDDSILVVYVKPYHDSTYDTYSGTSTIGSVTGVNFKFKFVKNDEKFEKEFKLESTQVSSNSFFDNISFV